MSMIRQSDIPIIERHRGVGIHDQQPRERIDTIVKPAIDDVLSNAADLEWLLSFIEKRAKPPEARLLAGMMIEAMVELAVEERRQRPAVDLAVVCARVSCLGSNRSRDSAFYGSIFEPRPGPHSDNDAHPMRREEPLRKRDLK